MIIILLLSLLVIAGFSQLARWRIGVEKAFVLTIRVVYENRDLRESWVLTEDDLMLGLFMNNSWQTAYLINVSYPIKEITYDSDGNPVALLNITDRTLGPNERLSYNVTYKFVLRQREMPALSEDNSGTLRDIPENLKMKYCKPTGLWPSNATIFREKALDIANNETKVLTIIKRFVRWIAYNIDYGPSEIPRYPNETLSLREGDCDDQANLLIAFCRAVGIPAYLQIGCIYLSKYDANRTYWSGHLVIRQIRVGWHGWAMVYIPPWGWLPVDLTYVKGDLRRNPLNSIKFSALISEYTFQYINIVETDYVAEARDLKEFLEKHEFYIYEEEEMREILIEETSLIAAAVIHPTVGLNRLKIKSPVECE